MDLVETGQVAIKFEGPRQPPPPPFCDPEVKDCCGPNGTCEDDDDDDVEMNRKGKVKSSCERCSVAKVRCSGEMPCERCVRKGFDCEYKMEKKRGRRTAAKIKKNLCSDASCWGQVVMNPINKCEDFGAKFGLESVERRIFQTFFAIYKHHATPQSCCREWFTYQLNKMSTFLLSNGNREGQEKLDAWMRKKGVEVKPHDPADYAKVPANVIDEVSGQKLPPINPMKGPKMAVNEAPANSNSKRKRSKGAQVYSTRGFYCDDIADSPVDREIEAMRSKSCFMNLRATHERFEVEVNEEFTALFGYTTRDIMVVLERLFGGLLPWGCDLLALIMANDHDLLFFMRILALKFNSIGRPAKFPATRQALSTHIFEFETKNGDIVECVLKCVHREYLSLERTEVDIFFGFDPTMPTVPRLFRGTQGCGEKRRLVSFAGQDSSGADSYRIQLPGQRPNAGRPTEPMMPTFSESRDYTGEDDATSVTSGVSQQTGYTHNTGGSSQGDRHSAYHQQPQQYLQYSEPGTPYGTPGAFSQHVRETSDPTQDYPDNNLEGLDFLDSMMNWAEGDSGDLPLGGDGGGPPSVQLGNMSLGALSNVSDNYAPSMAYASPPPVPPSTLASNFSVPPRVAQRSCALDLLPEHEGEGATTLP